MVRSSSLEYVVLRVRLFAQGLLLELVLLLGRHEINPHPVGGTALGTLDRIPVGPLRPAPVPHTRARPRHEHVVSKLRARAHLMGADGSGVQVEVLDIKVVPPFLLFHRQVGVVAQKLLERELLAAASAFEHRVVLDTTNGVNIFDHGS